MKENNNLDREIFNQYLEIMRNVPVHKINDNDFLAATHHLDAEAFLEAVWVTYLKNPISDAEKYSLIGYIDQKASRRGLIKFVVRHALEGIQISPVEKFMIFLWKTLKKIIHIILIPFKILFEKSQK